MGQDGRRKKTPSTEEKRGTHIGAYKTFVHVDLRTSSKAPENEAYYSKAGSILRLSKTIFQEPPVSMQLHLTSTSNHRHDSSSGTYLLFSSMRSSQSVWLLLVRRRARSAVLCLAAIGFIVIKTLIAIMFSICRAGLKAAIPDS